MIWSSPILRVRGTVDGAESRNAGPADLVLEDSLLTVELTEGNSTDAALAEVGAEGSLLFDALGGVGSSGVKATWTGSMLLLDELDNAGSDSPKPTESEAEDE